MNVDVHRVILKNEGSVCLFFCVPELSQEREGASKTHSLFLCHQMKGKEVVAVQWMAMIPSVEMEKEGEAVG